MKVLVTGSAGHLGEGLVRTLTRAGHEVVSLDLLDSPFTTTRASICDRGAVRRCMEGVDAVLHAATLHKPHVATHPRQAFVDTNVTGTLTLLEEAVAARARAFVFTSTTSAFGRALTPGAGAPAAWITEDVRPIPKNIYGATKVAAEELCELVHRDEGLPCLVLRTSRFFPEDDDDPATRRAYAGENAKANELLYRRVDLEDAVDAHLLAIARAPTIGFGRYIISATTPFTEADTAALRKDAAAVVLKRFPEYEQEYARRGWSMFPSLDRVYVNRKARDELGWRPRFDFSAALERLRAGEDPRSSFRRAGSPAPCAAYHPATPSNSHFEPLKRRSPACCRAELLEPPVSSDSSPRSRLRGGATLSSDEDGGGGDGEILGYWRSVHARRMQRRVTEQRQRWL